MTHDQKNCCGIYNDHIRKITAKRNSGSWQSNSMNLQKTALQKEVSSGMKKFNHCTCCTTNQTTFQ